MEHASNPPLGTAFSYEDFELQIGEGKAGQYPLQVIRSPAGGAQGSMQFPFRELRFENYLKDLRIALLDSGGQRNVAPSPEQQSVQDFGRQLFEALFSGEVRSRYDVSRQEARRMGKGLRLKLRIEAPDLAAVPWEYLRDPREDYLSLSVTTPIVRYLDIPKPVEPLTVTLPLRILGMATCPRDQRKLDIAYEKQLIEEATKGLRAGGVIELEWLPGQTWRDLQRALRRGKWHVFHFIGHGGFDRNTQEGFVALADEQGETHRFMATELGRLLGDHADRGYLRFVLLNSCEGAKGSEHDVLSSTASKLVQQGIPAVLAMQYRITDAAAIEFARSFYESLADGMAVDSALAEARIAVSVEVPNTVEWGTPVLFMRGEGRIFDVTGATRPGAYQQKAGLEVTGEGQPEPHEEEQPIIDEEMQERLKRLYLDGREAMLLGDWDKACGKFREVVGLQAAYRDATDQLEQAEVQRRRHRWYDEAQAAQEAGDWPTAVKVLEALVKEAPDFPDAAALLRDMQNRKQLADLYEEARQFAGLQKWQAVRKAMERIRELDAEYPDPDGLLAKASEALQGIERQRKVEALYERGLKRFEAAQWAEAIKAFEAIQQLEPGYRESEALLARAQNRQREIDREHQLGELYERAQAAVEAKKWPAAIKALEKLVAQAPDYRDADDLLEAAKTQKQLAGLYAKARRLHGGQDWQGVVGVFDKIKAIDADYPDVEGLLVQAQRKLAAPAKRKRRELAPLSGHSDAVWSVSFRPDGSMLASGAWDGTVMLWDAQKGQLLQTLKGHTGWVRSVAFHPDGSTLASGSWDGTVRLWDVHKGQLLHTLREYAEAGPGLKAVMSVAFAPDGSTLASGTWDGTVMLWDAHTGQCMRSRQGRTSQAWIVGSGKVRLRSSLFSGKGSTSQVPNLLRPDGVEEPFWRRDLLRTSGDYLWRPSREGHTPELRGAPLWSTRQETPSRPAKQKIQANVLQSVAFHPDGLMLATAWGDGKVRLWGVQEGQPEHILVGHTETVFSVAFHPNGSTLASGSLDQKVMLWDVQTGHLLRALEGHTGTVNSVAFHPNGSTLASGSADGKVMLWDVKTGQILRTLEGHAGAVYSVAFHPDGSTLASASQDKTVRLWDIRP